MGHQVTNDPGLLSVTSSALHMLFSVFVSLPLLMTGEGFLNPKAKSFSEYETVTIFTTGTVDFIGSLRKKKPECCWLRSSLGPSSSSGFTCSPATPNLIKEIHCSKKQYYCSEGILKPFIYPSSSTSAELDLNPHFSQFTQKPLSSIQETHPFSRSQCQSCRYKDSVTVSELTAHDAPSEHSPYLGNKPFQNVLPFQTQNYNSDLRLYLAMVRAEAIATELALCQSFQVQDWDVSWS